MNRLPVLSYNGKIKSIWNTLILFAILCFSVVLSYRLVFHQFRTDGFYWILMAIFALDIAFNFNVAVKKNISIIQDRNSIANNYLTGWFTIDLLAAIPFDLILLIIFGTIPVDKMNMDIYLLLQAFPLLKLLKVGRLMNELLEWLGVNPGIIRLLVFAFWFTQAVHYMALGWVLIGAVEANRIPIDQYIRSLYWCLTTVATIGYGDYYPNHDSNRQIIFTMVVQVFGVGMYGYIIGNVSGLIANLDVAKAGYMKKMEEINNYLHTNKIPQDLQERIHDYYSYLWYKQKNVSSVSVLEEIPKTLSLEILLFLNSSIFTKVELFKKADEIFIREAVQILKPMVFLPEDYIIRQGEYGDCMYFLTSGEVEVLVSGNQVARLGPGSPFGETALIKDEKRMASIKAMSYCDCYQLSKNDFDVLRSKYPEFDAQVKEVVAKRELDTQKKTSKNGDK